MGISCIIWMGISCINVIFHTTIHSAKSGMNAGNYKIINMTRSVRKHHHHKIKHSLIPTKKNISLTAKHLIQKPETEMKYEKTIRYTKK